MKVTERQKEILNSLIEEYVSSAQPVSSKLLEKKYDFEISPATIRIELQKLTDAGFIFQPHTSAGRVPTDKGYRFFVNNLLKKEDSGKKSDSGIDDLFPQEFESAGDKVKFIQAVTKRLADISSGFVLGYLFGEKILWKEGWENLLLEPEFKESHLISDFAKIIQNLEEDLDDFNAGDYSEIKIYIGRENPFSSVKEFSAIIEKCCFPNKEEGLLAIIGPKRMAYDKNISLFNSLTKLLSYGEQYGEKRK